MFKTIESEARFDQKFWAHQRQNIGLLNRTARLDRDLLIDAVKSELADILDSGIISYPPTLLRLGTDWYSTLDQRKLALGVTETRREVCAADQKFLDHMKQKAENGRKQNWQWRISEEASEKQKLGWYPFFITLTVDPSNVRFDESHPEHRPGVTDPESLWKNGREFRLFIRSLVNIVCEELGHPPAHKKTKTFDYRPESDYVTYAAVIEHGKSREHHHAHMLVWMREIPSSWKVCPNLNIRNPHARTFNECKEMRTLWKWSLPYRSKFNYYRTIGDVWKNLGFVTPLKEVPGKSENQPMKIAPAFVAGRYITKYMQKDLKEWHHRMKCTRNLGMNRLKQKLKQLDPETIEQLTWRPKSSSTLHLASLTHSAPLALVRSQAKQLHYLNRYKSNSMDLEEHLKPISGAFTKMLKSVRAGARPDRMHSLAFFDWVSQFLPEEKGYSEETLIEAHKQLSEDFPRNVIQTQSVTLPGAQIGFT